MKLMDHVDEYISCATKREIAFAGVCLTALGVLFGTSVCQKCKPIVRVLAGLIFVGGVVAAVLKYIDCSLQLCCCDDDCDCCDDDCDCCCDDECCCCDDCCCEDDDLDEIEVIEAEAPEAE